MDSAIGFLFVMVVLCLFLFLGGLAYKNRAIIAKWLNAPYYAEDDRELKLSRRIEDCQREVRDIQRRKAETEAKAETGD